MYIYAYGYIYTYIHMYMGTYIYTYICTVVLNYLNKFWNQETDFESWHRSQCMPVPKSGDMSDPNKWQGVMLMMVMSRIFSCTMNERAFQYWTNMEPSSSSEARQNLDARTYYSLSRRPPACKRTTMKKPTPDMLILSRPTTRQITNY